MSYIYLLSISLANNKKTIIFQVIATSMSQLTQELTSTNRDGEVILSISDKQKIQYLSQNFESGKSKRFKNNEKSLDNKEFDTQIKRVHNFNMFHF